MNVSLWKIRMAMRAENSSHFLTENIILVTGTFVSTLFIVPCFWKVLDKCHRDLLPSQSVFGSWRQLSWLWAPSEAGPLRSQTTSWNGAMDIPMRPGPNSRTVSPLEPQSIFFLSKFLGEEEPHSCPQVLAPLHKEDSVSVPGPFLWN